MRRGPTGSFVPYLGNNGVLGCDVHYNTTGIDDFFNGGALTPNAWYNIVVTHSGPTGATVLYVNGEGVQTLQRLVLSLILGQPEQPLGC